MWERILNMRALFSVIFIKQIFLFVISYDCCCCSVVSDSLWPHELQHASLPYPLLSLLKLISTESVMPSIYFICLLFSSCQSFSTSTFFPMSQLFASGGKSIGASASTMSEYTGLFLWDWLVWSSCRPRDSQVFFSTTVLKHHFFGAQPSLMSKSLICTWLLKNHSFDYADLGQQSDVSAF